MIDTAGVIPAPVHTRTTAATENGKATSKGAAHEDENEGGCIAFSKIKQTSCIPVSYIDGRNKGKRGEHQVTRNIGGPDQHC